MIDQKIMWRRAAVIQELRRFFIERDYLEVDTPIRVPAVIPESSIEQEQTGSFFLQSSPELYMKRLLAAGCKKIFQICKCFRANERGKLHLPEFLMLEWYREGCDYLDLMDDCEELFLSVCNSLEKKFPGGFFHSFPLSQPWQRLTVADAFDKYARLGLEDSLGRDLFDLCLVEDIEVNLGVDQPTFLYDYPVSMASLARVKVSDNSVAERFELYINGIELANGFSELIDSREQYNRFLEERESIRQQGRKTGPMPDAFLKALDSMAPTAGIALGVDRMVMLLTGANCVDQAVTFIPEEL
jgi:elongation factor P--(R)-beta-lysine ligase